MAKICGKDTLPEILVRKRLFSLGWRYRVCDKRFQGKPDIVIPKAKTIIDVRGCFWHRHGCKDSTMPKSNIAFWMEKWSKNVKRDHRNEAAWRDAGWNLIIVWQCALEGDKSSAFDFAYVTARRLTALYTEWWNTLNIGALLSECYRESRRAEVEAFANTLRARFPEAAGRVRIVFNAADGLQKDVKEPWDWARPWISCGIGGTYREGNSNDAARCFLCKTFQNGNLEYGLRRHPDEILLGGKDEWWIPQHYRETHDCDFFEYANGLMQTDPHSGESFRCE